MTRKRVSKQLRALFERNKGIKLDVGCGDNKQPGFIGMDYRATKNADIVHNCEDVPYPIPDETCMVILASHLVEHLKPWLMVDVMNEWWRIAKVGGQLWISTPYAGSFGFWQDPTHTKGWNEATPTYFDPVHFLYNIYKPKPWKIVQNNWVQTGNMELILEKRPLNHGVKTPGGYDQFPAESKKAKKRGKSK